MFGFCLDCYTETQNSLDRFKLGSPNVRRGPCLRMMRQEYIGSFKEGEGKGRDNRSSISVMQCGIRLQRHCVHCVGTSSFFLHAIIPSLIWTSTAASPVSLCPFVMLALIVFCLPETHRLPVRNSVAEADAVSPNYHVQVLLAQLSNISSAQFRDSGDRKVVFEKLRSLRRLNVVLIFLVMQMTFRSCDSDEVKDKR